MASESGIAITIPRLVLKKSSDVGRDAKNEPYIVTSAIDSKGTENQQPTLGARVFPRVSPGEAVGLIGSGHLVYGPGDPGDFVAFSILVAESDKDLGDALGAAHEQVKSNDKFKEAIKKATGISAAVAGAGMAIDVVLAVLNRNKDDQLYRVDGTFLRDVEPGYRNCAYTVGNEYVELTVQVFALGGDLASLLN